MARSGVARFSPDRVTYVRYVRVVVEELVERGAYGRPGS